MSVFGLASCSNVINGKFLGLIMPFGETACLSLAIVFHHRGFVVVADTSEGML